MEAQVVGFYIGVEIIYLRNLTIDDYISQFFDYFYFFNLFLKIAGTLHSGVIHILDYST